MNERKVDDREKIWYGCLYQLSVRDQAGNGYTYLGSLIYQSNRGQLTLEGTHFDGGRILKTSTGYEIVYYVTDYLGSVRAVVDSSGTVREYNNYYPFGGRWQDMGSRFAGNRSRFNGKELQVTGQLGLLDYGARMYDPVLARWQGCDPAMQFANPFVFCANNPTAYIDKDGQFAWWLIGMGAMLGGYMGGSAANNNWNPFQWNWGSGKTWGGFFGGAIQGALQGYFSTYSYAYGLSIFSSRKATGWGKVFRGTIFSLNTLKIVGTGASLFNDFDNGMDIIRGNFLYQGDSFIEKIYGGLSRGSWEYPQQFAGNFLAHGRNGFRRNMEVSYFHGATVINRPKSRKYRGVTLGNMINGWQLQENNSAMLYHEYGHVIQSRISGPVYLPIGLLSLFAALRQDNGYWTEVHANRLAKNYFGADLWNETAGKATDWETGEIKYPTTY